MDAVNIKLIEKLNKYKIQEYDELKPHTKKMLNEIENYMEQSFSERLHAIDVLKNKKININKIVANTTVSKGTIYNNADTIKKYIDESIAEYDRIEKIEFPQKDEEVLKANNELKELIDKLTLELIDMNNLKLVNEKLLIENERIREENYLLIDEREEFSKEIREYKKQIRSLIKNGNNVISINKK